jgi:hypothetical protein
VGTAAGRVANSQSGWYSHLVGVFEYQLPMFCVPPARLVQHPHGRAPAVSCGFLRSSVSSVVVGGGQVMVVDASTVRH